MQTGDCAGFGKQPNATARRLLTRALWVGGLAVAGSVLGAASANAADVDPVGEPSGDLLGSLTSTIDPVTEIAGTLVADTDTLLTDELVRDDDLQQSQLSSTVDKPIDELVRTIGLDESQERESEARARAAERDAAIAGPTDRSMSTRRVPADETERAGVDHVGPSAGRGPEAGLVSLIGSVDRLLTKDVVPDVAASTGEFASAMTSEVLETAPVLEQPTFSTQAVGDPVGALADLVTMLDLPFGGGSRVLDPVTPLLVPLDPVVDTAMPVVANLGPWAAAHETAQLAPATPFALSQKTNTSDVAPRYSLDESGAARPAGQDGEAAVIHSSPDAGTDGHDPSDGMRGGLRPSLLVTPVAGLTVLHVGAPGAATSVDQAGPSSHALLPEEAVLRARLFSAAAYARSVEATPIREANDPPVSPD